MASEAGEGDWTIRWPASADRVELRDGRLVFHVQRNQKGAWTAHDVAAAERCYAGQRVTVSESGDVMFIGPPSSGAGTGVKRLVLHVTADQVESARALMRLRGHDRVDPLIRKLAETRPPAAPRRQP